MLGIPQQVWRLALLVTTLAVLSRGAPQVDLICHPVVRQPCMDMDQLRNLAHDVAQNLSTAHDQRILIQLKHFKKITRVPKLHSCVMTRMANFFELALKRILGLDMDSHRGSHSGPIVDLIGLMQHLEGCTRMKEEKCKGLFANADKGTLQENPRKNMQPRDWAIRQLQNLTQAEKNLGDPATFDKVLDELKLLPSFIKGPGIRKYARRQGSANMQGGRDPQI
ncbi:uncharacterized protein LOC134460345 [Engraulis encrasicolus]|uniref:uncharacterized protein LOC134460345 n=1 Tax=Engraulis encrasicolus TaxID=184585 RepID=UPI002FCEED47